MSQWHMELRVRPLVEPTRIYLLVALDHGWLGQYNDDQGEDSVILTLDFKLTQTTKHSETLILMSRSC